MRTPPSSAVPATCAPRAKVAFVSTYPPRPCGIATFTQDLRSAMAQVAPDLDLVVCPVDREALAYGPEAEFVLRQDEQADYTAAAAALADAGVGVVVIEHEYGIYGGPDGEWVAQFAEELDARGVPYLVTLHTVLSRPTAGQAAALRRLCHGAFTISVFTQTARLLAVQTGVAPADRIVVVPHGAPRILQPGTGDLDLDLSEFCGGLANIRSEVADVLAEAGDARVLSTFGLVSPGKGLETAIEAVAAIAPAHPDIRYVIAGRTHPEVARHEGETYRDKLTTLVADLGVTEHVRFIDHFLTDPEIAALLHRTQVFLTPYRSVEQISSGALTFALAAGCAAVSTAYHYARDMLGSGAGLLVEPHDTGGFADALHTLLADPERLRSARAAAARLGTTLGWPAVAGRFAEVVRTAVPAPAPAAPAATSLTVRGALAYTTNLMRLPATSASTT